MAVESLDEQVRALEERRAFVRPSSSVVGVRGADAARWLNDLVTAGVLDLREGDGIRSLVLTPTGRIRADMHVVRSGDGFLLVQALDQPERVEAILVPYVLSSDVALGPSDASPVLVPSDGGWRAAADPGVGAVEVGPAAAEAWRIAAGIARFPVDLDAESLPAEAGLDVPPVTDTGKGCYLGQESVARVRNLGHPARLLVARTAPRRVLPGDAVRTPDKEAGVVTSAAAAADGRTAVLARIRWQARGADLRTSEGVPLEAV